MPDPIYVMTETIPDPMEGATQFFVNCEREDWKFDTLCDLLETINPTQAAVFCNTRSTVDWLMAPERLANLPVQVACVYKGLSQAEREAALLEFRRGAARFLICDSAAGCVIDFQQCPLIVFFDMPPSNESYLQCLGRSVCPGHPTVPIAIVTTADVTQLREISEFYNVRIEELPDQLAKVTDLVRHAA
jgi:superfamily II DNA/RNA helicase